MRLILDRSVYVARLGSLTRLAPSVVIDLALTADSGARTMTFASSGFDIASVELHNCKVQRSIPTTAFACCGAPEGARAAHDVERRG